MIVKDFVRNNWRSFELANAESIHERVKWLNATETL